MSTECVSTEFTKAVTKVAKRKMSRPSRGDHDYLITAAEGTKLLNVTSEPRNWLKLIFAFKTRFNIRPFSKNPKKATTNKKKFNIRHK